MASIQRKKRRQWRLRRKRTRTTKTISPQSKRTSSYK